MKLKNMWKRFWTLDVHNHEGFTLVELIIVIAILAILSTGAIAGYSAYVESANKTADKALVSEIANVLALYYYSNPSTSGGYVTISVDGEVKADKNFGEQAMLDAYGSGWKNLRLKYSGWTADSSSKDSYINSSFKGNEASLLQQLGNLTDTMKDVLVNNPTLAGANFNQYVAGLDIEVDDQVKANAAVLYVASIAKDADAQKVNNAFNSFFEAQMQPEADDSSVLQLINALSGDAKLGDLGACATIYAQAEAFCQYIDAQPKREGQKSNLLEEFHAKTSDFKVTDDNGNVTTAAAVTSVAEVFVEIVDQAKRDGLGEFALGYVGADGSASQANKDTTAFLEAMGTVTEYEDDLVGRLNMKDCFTDGYVENLLVSIMGAKDGEIVIQIDADGNITMNPGAARGE